MMRYAGGVVATLLMLCIGTVALKAQDAAFNVEDVASTIVRLQNLDREIENAEGEFGPLFHSGLIVSSDGLIFSANVDFLTETGDQLEISLFTELDELPVPTYLGEVIAPDDSFDSSVIAIQITHDIDGNEIDPTTLDLPYINPISTTVMVDFTDVMFTASYPDVGENYLTTTQGTITAFDKPFNFTTEDVLEEVLVYQSDAIIDFQGLGGPVLNFAGQFVGIGIELPQTTAQSDDTLVQIMPISSICIIMRDICVQLLEKYRPTPEDRTARPSSRFWLTDGIGLTTSEVVPRGEVQPEYYCSMLGLRARMDTDETVWECYRAGSGETMYTLTAFDYDIICQQTYRNDEAVAIQDGSAFISPALRWRCYG